MKKSSKPEEKPQRNMGFKVEGMGPRLNTAQISIGSWEEKELKNRKKEEGKVDKS